MGICDITYCPPCWVPCSLQRFSSLLNLHIQGIHSRTMTPLLSNSILCCTCISNDTSIHQAPHPQQIQVPDCKSLWICEEQANKKKSTIYMRKPKEMLQGKEELPSSVNPWVKSLDSRNLEEKFLFLFSLEMTSWGKGAEGRVGGVHMQSCLTL